MGKTGTESLPSFKPGGDGLSRADGTVSCPDLYYWLFLEGGKMEKQLYAAVDDAGWIRITTDKKWVDKRPISVDLARRHLTEKGIAQVLSGKDSVFTERDQSWLELSALFE